MPFLLLLTLLLIAGCATSEIGRQITMDDAAWIQKGVTTRNEVETRFGSPNFEVPDYTTGSMHETTSTTTTTKDGDKRTTTTTVKTQRPRDTKATYLYTKSEAAVVPFYANVQTRQEKFWVTYDENGVVKDFGVTAKGTGARPPQQPNAQ